MPGDLERYAGEDYPEKASMMAHCDVLVTLYSTMVVEVGDRSTALLQPEESGLINAVFRLVKGKRPVVGYLQGHGEHRLAHQLDREIWITLFL